MACVIFVFENKKTMKHQEIEIIADDGSNVVAQAPIIISASRSTDIPALYTDWFFNRLEKGYVKWRNPFNGKYSYVSFAKTRFIVFWSKNPGPLLPHLHKLNERGVGCYIQYTLNDYENEGLEPKIPSLEQRVDTFKMLVDILGFGSVIWRFDPLILTDSISIETLLDKIENIGNKLKGYTEKIVFSFADISAYKQVERNLKQSGVRYREWDNVFMREFASRLSFMNSKSWGYRLATCSEAIDLSEYGIEHNHCIDSELISRLSKTDDYLQNFLYGVKTDKGQRKHCGCILSKDVGAYNTCIHDCVYCYANHSSVAAKINFYKHNKNNDSII